MQMDKLDYIKGEIEKLYQNNPHVHINVKITRSKIIKEDTAVTITGVYRNIFQIQETDGSRITRHTFQYGEVLVGQVVIKELDYAPSVSRLNNKK